MFTWGDDDDFVGELCTWGDDNAFVSITVTGKWFCRWGVYLGRQWWGTAWRWNDQRHTATSLGGCTAGWGLFFPHWMMESKHCPSSLVLGQITHAPYVYVAEFCHLIVMVSSQGEKKRERKKNQTNFSSGWTIVSKMVLIKECYH